MYIISYDHHIIALVADRLLTRYPGSGIAPFFPIPTEPSGIYLPLHIFLFLFRLPFLLTVALSYFVVLQWLPIGSLGKKACLWSILGVPGVWWIDLQIDGVRKGYVPSETLPLHTIQPPD